MRGFFGIVGAALVTAPIFGVEVRVLDRETGTPIGGALVISGGATNETDAAGRAVATGPKITAYKAGYVPLATSSESDLELKLSPGETIGGRVMDGASNAVSGAAIT